MGKRLNCRLSDKFFEVKVGTYSHINEYMKIFDYPRSRLFIALCPRSHIFNIFKLLFFRNCLADWSQISYGASMGYGEWKFAQLCQVTWPCSYMIKKKKKKKKKSSSSEPRGWWPWNLVHVYSIGYSNTTSFFKWWSWVLWHGQISNLFPIASAWMKAYTALRAHVFPSLVLFSISSVLRWAIQDHRSSGFPSFNYILQFSQ